MRFTLCAAFAVGSLCLVQSAPTFDATLAQQHHDPPLTPTRGKQALAVVTTTTATTTSSALIDTLVQHYESTIDRVWGSLTGDMLASLPLSLSVIYQPDSNEYQDQNMAIFDPLMDHLQSQLAFMKFNLLASVRPTVESNFPSATFTLFAAHDKNTASQPSSAVISALDSSIQDMNQAMEIQVALTVNAEETAHAIANQPTARQLILSLTKMPQRATYANAHMGGDQAMLRHTDAVLQESTALVEWLCSWFSEMEELLSIEFEDGTDDLSSLILDKLGFNESFEQPQYV